MTAVTRDDYGKTQIDAAVASPFRRFLYGFCESKLAVLGLLVFVGIALAAVFAPLISPTDPYDLTKLNIFDNR